MKVLSGDREVGRMNFKSPGIRVQWHKQLSLDTLLVAETRGVISIVDWKKKTYLKSLYAYAPGIAGGGEEFFGKEILLDCHWNHLDPYR